MKRCHCGKPLHYTDPVTRRIVEKLIAECGENVRVVTAEGAWLVPRHYIALHGLKAKDVWRLGFPRADAS